MEESNILVFGLMLLFGIIASVIEYYDRKTLAKEKTKANFFDKSLSWRGYAIIALGIYGAIRLILELMAR